MRASEVSWVHKRFGGSGGNRVYRASSGGWMYACFGAFSAASSVGWATATVLHHAPGAYIWVPGTVAIVLVGVALVVGMWRAYTQCVIVSHDEVVVRNTFRIHRIPWSAVAGFSWEPHPWYTRVAVVELTDGRCIPAAGIRSMQSAVNRDHGPGESEVERLNEELERRRPAGELPQAPAPNASQYR